MPKSRNTLERELDQADRRIHELGRERDSLQKANAILTRALKWYGKNGFRPDKALRALERKITA